MSNQPTTTTDQSARQFNFSEVFWEKTVMLLGFYWLFRWLCPSILPESLLTASFEVQVLVCGTGGFVFTILAALGHAAGAQPTTGRK